MYDDKNGNPRFMRDAKGAAGNYFVYYKYDNLSRKIEEGTMIASGNFKQPNADNPTYPATGNTWKVKYYYDTSTVPSLRNFKGRLYRIPVGRIKNMRRISPSHICGAQPLI